MGFNNSINKAYLDLATFGPMESMMYTREYFSLDKSHRVYTGTFIVFLMFCVLFILYFFVKEIKHQ